MWGELSVPVQCIKIKCTALYALAITHTPKIDTAIGNCIYITYISIGACIVYRDRYRNRERNNKGLQ